MGCLDLVSKTKADLVVLQEVTDDWDNQTAVTEAKVFLH
jgi:hypothetical protein